MFWELDFAGMDYSTESEYEIKVIKPSLAIGTGAMDWTTSLSKIDGNYMVQEIPGLVTEINFKAPVIPNDQIQSVFLHTRGYYELERDFSGLPDILGLNKFKTPGYFSEFSKNEYLNVLDSKKLVTDSR